MTEVEHEFRLSDEELGALRAAILNEPPLADLVASQAGALSRGEKLRLTRTDAEQLRGCLTTRLAVIGFGENYAINEQGRILEKLIDRFYLR